MKRFITMLALMLAALVSPVSAQDFPPAPEGPIYDAADLIPATEEQQISERLITYNRETGRSIVIATEASTNGQDIDLYSRDLAEFWGIGGAETEQGVLLYIARDDRKMAIKTARGVQGTLTDISSGRIIRNTLRPAFRAGDYAGGISQAVDQIIERLDMDPVEAAAVAEAEAAAERKRSSEGGFPIGALIWFAFIIFFFILPMLRGGSRKRRYRRGPWGDTARDIILWEAGKAIARGIDGSSRGGGWGGGGGFGGGGGGFGGFGGGGGGFNGGGASGGW
ncbi:MAG: TPM domain-containing protein [Qipengyuania vulgaris]